MNEINGRNGWGYQPKPIGPENTDLKGNPLKRNRIPPPPPPPPPRTGKESGRPPIFDEINTEFKNTRPPVLNGLIFGWATFCIGMVVGASIG